MRDDQKRRLIAALKVCRGFSTTDLEKDDPLECMIETSCILAGHLANDRKDDQSIKLHEHLMRVLSDWKENSRLGVEFDNGTISALIGA